MKLLGAWRVESSKTSRYLNRTRLPADPYERPGKRPGKRAGIRHSGRSRRSRRSRLRAEEGPIAARSPTKPGNAAKSFNFGQGADDGGIRSPRKQVATASPKLWLRFEKFLSGTPKDAPKRMVRQVQAALRQQARPTRHQTDHRGRAPSTSGATPLCQIAVADFYVRPISPPGRPYQSILD